MKKFIIVLLTITMLISLFGCNSESTESTDSLSENVTGSEDTPETPEDPIKIGFSVITLTFPAYVSLQEGIIEACDNRGWEYQLSEAGMDVEKTINDCLDLLSKDIDALVIASWYGDSLGEVFDTAKNKNIPVFMIDTGGLPDTGYITHIGVDDYQAGYEAGKWSADYLLNEKGISEIDYISLTSATTVGRNRSDGFLKALNDFDGVTVNLLQEYLDDSRENFMSIFEDALVTYQNIDLVFSSSAQGSLGAFDACDAANRDSVYIVGFDNEDDERELIDRGTQYIASVDQLRLEQAELTMQCVEDYLVSNVEFDIKTDSPIALYTVDGFVDMD